MTSDFNTQHRLETYKSLIILSTECFKYSILINGGAAVALLAYLGNVASKGGTPPDMREAMIAFLFGLLMCGITLFFSYITQLELFNESRANSRNKGQHRWWLWLAIISFVFSLFSFAAGSLLAVISFK